MRSSSGTSSAPEPSGASTETKRGRISVGTFTRANTVGAPSPPAGSRTSTARLRDRFEMYGKGRPGATASGVSAGKIARWKCRASCSRWRSSSSATLTMRMPCAASSGRSRPSKQSARRRPWRSTCSRIRPIVWEGISPSWVGFSTPASIWSCRPATLTM